MSTTAAASRVGRELATICGARHVLEGPPQHVLGCAPAVCVTPGSAEEIAAVLRFANRNDLVVAPAGGSTQLQMGKTPAQVDILLHTTRLTKVEHYDPGDLTVGIGAGSTVGHLASMVWKDQLLFAGDPPLASRATVGGLLATGIGGPLRHGYGGLRDYCIGIRFVTGDGRIGKAGGRVVKNVAGYDIMKLLIGSQGTLAVITGASFKLFPAPRHTRTYITCFANAAEALAFRDRVLGSALHPMCLELLSPEAQKLLVPDLREDGLWCICIRAAGSQAVLARYRSELGSAVAHQIDGASESVFWHKIAEFAHIAREVDPDCLLVGIVAPLRDVRRVLDVTNEVSAANGFTTAAVGRIGVGHVLVSMLPAVDQELTKANYIAAVGALNQNLPHDASMAVRHCPAEARNEVSHVRTPTHLGSMLAVKRALDPKNILNRGRFLF